MILTLALRPIPMRPFAALIPLVAVACAAPAVAPTAPVSTPSRGADQAVVGAPAEGGRVGVLVMAHGGTPEWNASVHAAVAPLGERVPTAVAFGMANPLTLSAALDELETAGVARVAVVRMFLSGESFLDQTRYYLGMSPEAPETFVLMGPAAGDPAARVPVEHPLAVATHEEGILLSQEAGDIMLDRARALSVAPDVESVLLLAHGMGDDEENRRVLDAMDRIGARISELGFASVKSATLREDWEDARAAAEEEIRAWVRREDAAGRRVLVLPMRLSGFGPYAGVLAGLPYVAGDGLLPHEAIGRWVRGTANRVSCGHGWGAIAEGCPESATASPAPIPPR